MSLSRPFHLSIHLHLWKIKLFKMSFMDLDFISFIPCSLVFLYHSGTYLHSQYDSFQSIPCIMLSYLLFTFSLPAISIPVSTLFLHVIPARLGMIFMAIPYIFKNSSFVCLLSGDHITAAYLGWIILIIIFSYHPCSTNCLTCVSVIVGHPKLLLQDLSCYWPP